jgi:hypothetical protein
MNTSLSDDDVRYVSENITRFADRA